MRFRAPFWVFLALATASCRDSAGPARDVRLTFSISPKQAQDHTPVMVNFYYTVHNDAPHDTAWVIGVERSLRKGGTPEGQGASDFMAPAALPPGGTWTSPFQPAIGFALEESTAGIWVAEVKITGRGFTLVGYDTLSIR